jgi:carbamoyl-phosphate synthase small subunit
MSASSFTAPAPNAVLLFEDGTEYQGYGIGAEGIAYGELCFNTAMTGYQEILTDPSYFGQIITFTTPHIGNVGANVEDIESYHIKAQGLVIREPITDPANWRSGAHFQQWLLERDMTGISGIDTREITTAIRKHGHSKVAIAYHQGGLREIDRNALMTQLVDMDDMHGAELTQYVRTRTPYEWHESLWQREAGYGQGKGNGFHVVAIDYGAKLNILRHLTRRGCKVTVVGGDTPLMEVLALQPDGIFLSNGPGDPAATAITATPVIQGIVERGIPLFGICLGHQLLALACGAQTEKLYQGHRGANHPVKNLRTNEVEITSQNHGFVVQSDMIPETIEVTHISLFDGTIEGIKHRNKPAFSVQYHPESSPGPHDSLYLFDEFIGLMKARVL